MVKIKKFMWLFFLSFSILLYTGCSNNESKTENAQDSKTEIDTELLMEQNDLYEKVCKDFSDINQKVVGLNDKIHSMEGKLSEAQNSAIDEVEKMRSSIHTRMNSMKKVASADWENFKTTLESDIQNVKSQIDEIIETIE